jgi:hypothetical protein
MRSCKWIFACWFTALANHTFVQNPSNSRYSSIEHSSQYTSSYRLDDLGSILGKGKIFLFSTAPRAALGPTKPPIQSVPGSISRECSGRSVKLTTHFHLVSVGANGAAIPPLPHMSSWHSALTWSEGCCSVESVVLIFLLQTPSHTLRCSLISPVSCGLRTTCWRTSPWRNSSQHASFA